MIYKYHLAHTFLFSSQVVLTGLHESSRGITTWKPLMTLALNPGLGLLLGGLTRPSKIESSAWGFQKVTDLFLFDGNLLSEEGTIWLVVSTHLKNSSQIGSFPQVGVKIKNIWNHHLVIVRLITTHRRGPGNQNYPDIFKQSLPTSASKRSTWNNRAIFFCGGRKAKTGNRSLISLCCLLKVHLNA